jgi:hypothetical protein
MPVIAVGCHPGVTDTALFRHVGIARIVTPLIRPFINTAAMGAWPALHAATGKAMRGSDCGPIGPGGLRGPSGEASRGPQAQDPELAERLWDVSVDRRRGSGQGRHREPVGTREQRLDATEQRRAVKHGALILDPADIDGQCKLPDKGFAQFVPGLLRQRLEPAASDRVIDGAPDRLDIKAVTRELLELRAKSGQPLQACAKTGSDVGRHRPASRRQAEQDSAPAQIAARRGRLDEIRRNEADRPGIGSVLSCHRLHRQGRVGNRAGGPRHIGLVAERVLHPSIQSAVRGEIRRCRLRAALLPQEDAENEQSGSEPSGAALPGFVKGASFPHEHAFRERAAASRAAGRSRGCRLPANRPITGAAIPDARPLPGIAQGYRHLIISRRR